MSPCFLCSCTAVGASSGGWEAKDAFVKGGGSVRYTLVAGVDWLRQRTTHRCRISAYDLSWHSCRLRFPLSHATHDTNGRGLTPSEFSAILWGHCTAGHIRSRASAFRQCDPLCAMYHTPPPPSKRTLYVTHSGLSLFQKDPSSHTLTPIHFMCGSFPRITQPHNRQLSQPSLLPWQPHLQPLLLFTRRTHT